MADVEHQAREILPPNVWDFVSGGSGSEIALRANRAALDAVAVIPRVLTGAGPASTSTKLLSTDTAMPVAVAPMAYQQLVHPGGELETAVAARDCGVPLVVSTLSSRPVEEIAATGVRTWFQLYWLDDKLLVRDLVSRAEQAGCEALILTADAPVMARRWRDIRNDFTLPPEVRAAHLVGGIGDDDAHVRGTGSAVATHTAKSFHPGLSWQQVERLCEWTDLPVVVKGVLDPRDAILAVRSGADAVVVSNHGGRQFDAAPGTCEQLEAVVQAVGGVCTVLFDSGVRTGTDVLRALALGADGVLLGRPVLWGLAAGGRAGVSGVLALLRTELTTALTLAGCASPRDARDLVTRVGYP
ncbi:MAG: alpha-hydroxy-acid oxidizing protein [Actinobacteria bacterium]|nr:alpha-hydroxy-acid oxidizing protein [Acidobacteriota bacterium]MCA1727243.1 alpha-hydroxy-acid oxidizing protein [Actinomycetota bacterium]